jgi:phospholipid-binding lipoprotein MlaA
MSHLVSPRWILALAAIAGMSACVTLPPNHPRSRQDPWESWNRGVYKVNDKLDRAIALPVTRAYVRHVPSPVRTGVTNFFANVNTPVVMVNDALQGKFKAAGTDLGRFLMNSTLGVGGIFDPATSAGLDKNHEDFGLTLGHWGVHPGPFVELPLLGPSDVRDTVGKVADIYLTPTHYIPRDYSWVEYILFVPEAVDIRAALLPLQPTIDQAFDPYALVRDAYLSRRAYQASDGKVAPDTELIDPDADQTPAPGGPSIATPPKQATPPAGSPPANPSAPKTAPQPANPPAPKTTPPSQPPPDDDGDFPPPRHTPPPEPPPPDHE